MTGGQWPKRDKGGQGDLVAGWGGAGKESKEQTQAQCLGDSGSEDVPGLLGRARNELVKGRAGAGTGSHCKEGRWESGKCAGP